MLRCTNCKKIGHINKNCRIPVTSYGVICMKFHRDLKRYFDKFTSSEIASYYVRFDHTLLFELEKQLGESIYKSLENEFEANIEFLMIRRRHSFAYVEFALGYYNLGEPNYILSLLKEMSYLELQNIRKLSLNEIWLNIWNESSEKHKANFTKAENKFNQLKNGYQLPLSSNIITLENLYDKIRFYWKEPEWTFPKGRINHDENILDCAQREFQEETNINKKKYHIIDIENTIYEKFKASNEIVYKNVYYLGQCENNTVALISIDNQFQNNEVGDIGWFRYDDCLNLFRTYNMVQIKMFNKLYHILKYICINGLYESTL